MESECGIQQCHCLDFLQRPTKQTMVLRTISDRTSREPLASLTNRNYITFKLQLAFLKPDNCQSIIESLRMLQKIDAMLKTAASKTVAWSRNALFYLKRHFRK